MKTPGQVVKLMIEKGLYDPGNELHYMCCVLDDALYRELIEDDEYDTTKGVIEGTIHPAFSLSMHIIRNNLTDKHDDDLTEAKTKFWDQFIKDYS